MCYQSWSPPPAWKLNELQCAAVWCSVLQCVAMRCNVLRCVTLCCSMLQATMPAGCLFLWMCVTLTDMSVTLVASSSKCLWLSFFLSLSLISRPLSLPLSLCFPSWFFACTKTRWRRRQPTHPLGGMHHHNKTTKNKNKNIWDDVKLSQLVRARVCNAEVVDSILAKTQKFENSNPYGFELHRLSSKGTKLLFPVIKAIHIQCLCLSVFSFVCCFLSFHHSIIKKLCFFLNLRASRASRKATRLFLWNNKCNTNPCSVSFLFSVSIGYYAPRLLLFFSLYVSLLPVLSLFIRLLRSVSLFISGSIPCCHLVYFSVVVAIIYEHALWF